MIGLKIFKIAAMHEWHARKKIEGQLVIKASLTGQTEARLQIRRHVRVKLQPTIARVIKISQEDWDNFCKRKEDDCKNI